MKKIFQHLIYSALGAILLGIFSFKDGSQIPYIPITQAIRQSFNVEVKTIGELEAARSLIIASSIKGDQGKIISLVADGVSVHPGDVLVKLDPTPFEEKLEKLKARMKEQEIEVSALEQAYEWEKSQADHKSKIAAYEIETAQLELDKMIHGDGPQEISRLKGAMQKAYLRFEELHGYSNDLLELEKQGFLNTAEIKQAQKKLSEEKEAYETAKMQHDSYVEHVYPMLVKKGETALKRAQIAQEEAAKLGAYGIAKAHALLQQAKHGWEDATQQIREIEKELVQTEIKAPASGMVVHREDYRNGQKRKPRVGDVLVKNQPLIDLPDLSAMVVKTRVRELDLYKVAVGKKATIDIDAYPELAFDGTIASIGVLAMGESGRTNEDKYFDIRIALDASDPRLRPGMTTRATIHVQEVKDVLTIPLHAVFNADHETYCYLSCPGGSYEKRHITLGVSNEQWIEVKDGLDEGAYVCLLNPLQ